MPRYTIVPIDQFFSPVEIEAADPAAVLGNIDRLDCREADVLADGVYAFSTFLNESGVWTIFERQGQSAEPDFDADMKRAGGVGDKQPSS